MSGLLDACSDTTEAGDQTFVTINSASPVVLRGDQLELTASLWIRTASGDSVEVPNAELMWTTDDPTLTPKDNRTAMATGVNSGVVGIHAIATGFQGSAQAVFPLRVSNPLEIDSMRPATVRYGEKVTMYGVGVNTLFFATLQNAALLPDTFSVARRRRRCGSAQLLGSAAGQERPCGRVQSRADRCCLGFQHSAPAGLVRTERVQPEPHRHLGDAVSYLPAGSMISRAAALSRGAAGGTK